MSSPVETIERDDKAWVVDGEHYGAVVLTAPARKTAPVLAAVSPEAERLLGRIEYADVIIVTLAVPTMRGLTDCAGSAATSFRSRSSSS